MARKSRDRRSIRLKAYDYARPGGYSVTVCTADRRALFGRIDNDEMTENRNAQVVRRCWEDLPVYYPHVSVDELVVMPNHLHGIIVLDAGTNGPANNVGLGTDVVWAGLKPAPTGGDASTDRVAVRHGLPEIVRALKTYSARRINASRGTPGAAVWQRGYHEHVIRNERALRNIREYIRSNPRNWRQDHENPLKNRKR